MCCTAGGREGHAASGNVHVSRRIVSAMHGEGRTRDAVIPEPTTLPFSGAPGTCSSASRDSGLQLAGWRLASTHPSPSRSRKAGETGLLILLLFSFSLILHSENPACFFLPVPSVPRVIHVFVDFHEGVKKCQALFCVLPKYKPACSVSALGQTSQPSRSPPEWHGSELSSCTQSRDWCGGQICL